MADEEVASLFAKLGLKLDKPSWKAGDDAIARVKEIAVGFFAYEGFRKIGELVDRTVAYGDHAVKAAQKIGITAESIQELGYAAGQSGSSAEELEGALAKLSHGLQNDLKNGSGTAIDALGRLGVSGSFAAEQMSKEGGLDNVLDKIADGFAAMPDNAQKTALAMDLFGRSGAQLIPFLNSGSAGISQLRGEANELGIVLDAQTGKALEAFGDDTDRVKDALAGLRNTAVTALLPVLQDMVTGLLEWVKANREAIASGIKGAVQALIFVFKGLAAAVGVVVDVFRFFAEHEELAEAALVAFGAVIAAFAAQAAINWAIAFAPLIAVGAAIFAAVVVVRKLWDWFKSLWDQLAHGDTVIARIVDSIKRIAGSIKDAFNSVKQFFLDIVQSIKDAWDRLGLWIHEKAKALLDNKVVRALMTASGNSLALNAADQAEAAAQQAAGGPSTEAATRSLEIALASVPRLQQGGATPTLAVPPSSVTVQNQFQISGTDPDEVAAKVIEQQKGSVDKAIGEHWDRQMRHADTEP